MTRALRLLPAALAAASALAQGTAPDKPLFRDIREQAGITFQHHAAPEKKFIVESMSGGVALFDFDNDGRLDLYFVDSLTVDTANDPKAARSALYRNLGGEQFEDVTDKAGVGHPGWGMGVCTADVDGDGWEDIYVTGLGPEPPLSQQPRRHLHRHRRAGGRHRRRLVGRLRLRRLRPRRRPRPVREPLREDRPREPARVRQGQDLRVPRHRRAVRAARPARRGGPALPQRGRRHASREVGEKAGVARPARVLRARASPGSTPTRTAGPTSSWPTTRRPNYLYLNQKDGTFKEIGLPHGRRGERGRRRAGQHGRRRRRLRQQRPLQPLRHELRRGVQRALPQRRRRTSPTSPSARRRRPAACPTWAGARRSSTTTTTGWLDIIVANGHVYPQLDQARLGASRRLPAAPAALPQPRRRHVRGGRPRATAPCSRRSA